MYHGSTYEQKMYDSASDEDGKNRVRERDSDSVFCYSHTSSLYHYVLFKQERLERAITHVGLAVSQGWKGACAEEYCAGRVCEPSRKDDTWEGGQLDKLWEHITLMWDWVFMFEGDVKEACECVE